MIYLYDGAVLSKGFPFTQRLLANFVRTKLSKKPTWPREWLVSLTSVIGQHEKFYQYLSNLKRGSEEQLSRPEHMIYDIAIYHPALNHLKIIALRATMFYQYFRSSSKEVLRNTDFRIKLAGPNNMICVVGNLLSDILAPPVYCVWTNISFCPAHKLFAENSSRYF